jgi:hypothetical protein
MSLENDHTASAPSEMVGVGQAEDSSPNYGVVVLRLDTHGAIGCVFGLSRSAGQKSANHTATKGEMGGFQ